MAIKVEEEPQPEMKKKKKSKVNAPENQRLYPHVQRNNEAREQHRRAHQGNRQPKRETTPEPKGPPPGVSVAIPSQQPKTLGGLACVVPLATPTLVSLISSPISCTGFPTPTRFL